MNNSDLIDADVSLAVRIAERIGVDLSTPPVERMSMDHYRRPVPIEGRPDGFFDGGHFWLREFLPGGVMTMAMAPSGMLTFAGPTAEIDPGAAWPYRRAVKTVRSAFDRDGFRNAVKDVSAYEFSLLTPLGMGLSVDWQQLPPVFGLDVWDGMTDSFAPVDVAERVFEAVGIETIPVVKREVPARELSASGVSMPQASYADEPAAGVVLQKKRGQSVVARRPAFTDLTRAPPAPAGSPSDLEAWVTETVDTGLFESYGFDGEQSIAATPITELVEVVAAEISRRQFDAVGRPALTEPNRFRDAIHDRVITLRNPGRA